MRTKIVSILIGSLIILALAIIVSFKKVPTRFLLDTEISRDATSLVLNKVDEALNEAASELVFEKGVYHFYPDKGKELFCFISNHDDVRIRTAFPIINGKDLTIDGQGSKFVFHGRMIPFVVENSQNIKIKNLSIDWQTTFHSEGLVVANDQKYRTFDLQISEEYPYEIRNGELRFIKEGFEHTIGQSIAYDPTRQEIAFDTEAYTPITAGRRSSVNFHLESVYENYPYELDVREPLMTKIGQENRLKAEQLEPGLVRIHNHKKKLPKVGWVLACKGEKGENRVAPAIRVLETENIELSDVIVHHAGGMGLIAENSEDITLDRFHVKPSQGRMVSTTADATHFVGCRGKVILKDCVFNNQLDDASNVHGSYQKVIDILGDHRLGIRVGHFQQQNFKIGRPNDKIGLIRLEDSFYPYDSLTLKEVEVVNGRYQILTFKERIPPSLAATDLLENLDGYPEFIVENCKISRNRARGLLISTPRKVVIRNNYFSTEMEPLLIPVESGYWYESGSASDVLIENNTFTDCLHSGQNRGLIRLVTDDENGNIAFKNVKIVNNEFNHFDNLVLEINNAEHLTFTNNTINHSKTFPQLFPENPVVTIRASTHLEFADNDYFGKAKTIFVTDGNSAHLKL